MTDEKPKSRAAKSFETIDKLIHESNGKLRYTTEAAALAALGLSNIPLGSSLEEVREHVIVPKDEVGSLTIFACGPAPGHKCDNDGPEAKIMSPCRECGGTGTSSEYGGVLNCPRCKATGERESGSSVSCSVCGMSAYDRSMWEDP